MEQVCVRAMHGVYKKTIVTKEINPYLEENIQLRRKKGRLFRCLGSCRVRAMRHDQSGFETSQSQSSSALKAVATPMPVTTKKLTDYRIKTVLQMICALHEDKTTLLKYLLQALLVPGAPALLDHSMPFSPPL